jgi:hypothetical protein
VSHQFLGLIYVVLNLYTLLNLLIHLNILEPLRNLLNFPASLRRVLKVQPVDHGGQVAEPPRIVFIYVGLAPVSIATEVLGDFIHILDTLSLVVRPDLGLLRDQVGKDVLHNVLVLGKIEDKLHYILLSGGLIRGVVNDLL